MLDDIKASASFYHSPFTILSLNDSMIDNTIEYNLYIWMDKQYAE